MKKNILSFICTIALMAFSFSGISQMQIHVKVSGISCDSIKIQSFNWKKGVIL